MTWCDQHNRPRSHCDGLHGGRVCADWNECRCVYAARYNHEWKCPCCATGDSGRCRKLVANDEGNGLIIERTGEPYVHYFS